MRALLPLCALLALPGLNAQIVITEKAPAAQPAQPAQDDASDSIFYKAFYLAEGARQYDQAIDLYKQFLAASPKSKLAPRAARSLVNLLYRTDKVDAAEAAKKDFAALLEQAPAAAGAGEQDARPRGEGGQRQRPPQGRGEGGAPGQAPASTEQIEARKRQIKQAEEQLAEAKNAGDEEAAARLTRQIQRYKDDLAATEARGAGGQGGRPGARQPGGQGGGRMARPFAEMTQEEATQAVERMGGMVDFVRQRQGDEAAKKMEDSIAKMKDLIKEGKLAEADKIRAEMMPAGGAGGRGPGGRGMRPLTEMTKEEALQSIERLEGQVDRIRESQGDEAAKKVEESIKKIKDLINAGKLEEAEKVLAEMRRTMFRRGG